MANIVILLTNEVSAHYLHAPLTPMTPEWLKSSPLSQLYSLLNPVPLSLSCFSAPDLFRRYIISSPAISAAMLLGPRQSPASAAQWVCPLLLLPGGCVPCYGLVGVPCCCGPVGVTVIWRELYVACRGLRSANSKLIKKKRGGGRNRETVKDMLF